MNDSLRIIADNLLNDQKKLARLYRRYPLYLEDLARELIPPHTNEVGDEELALSYSQMKEELASLTEKNSSDFFLAHIRIL